MQVVATRIVSFLPAATEMVCALGLEDRLLGISHECDWPPHIRHRPVVVRPALAMDAMTVGEIDRAVSAQLNAGDSLYAIDEQLLRDLEPDLVLTQDLCRVCAPSGNDVTRVLASLPGQPKVLWLTPRSLVEVEDNLRAIAAAAGVLPSAERLVDNGRARLQRVADRVRGAKRPRVLFVEWVDPIYCGGHWMPEMIEIAGGTDSIARRGADSVRIDWNDVVSYAPEVLIISPCGFHLQAAVEQLSLLSGREGWRTIPAVQAGRVFAVDANAYFARPGPRLVDGVELLAHILHAELVPWAGASDAFARVRAPSSPAPTGCRGML